MSRCDRVSFTSRKRCGRDATGTGRCKKHNELKHANTPKPIIPGTPEYRAELWRLHCIAEGLYISKDTSHG